MSHSGFPSSSPSATTCGLRWTGRPTRRRAGPRARRRPRDFWNIHAAEEVVSRLDQLLPAATDIPPALRALRSPGSSRGLARPRALRVLRPGLRGEPGAVPRARRRSWLAGLLQRLGNSAHERGELERARDLLRAVAGDRSRTLPTTSRFRTTRCSGGSRSRVVTWRVALSSFAGAPGWRPTWVGTGGGREISGGWRSSGSTGEISTRRSATQARRFDCSARTRIGPAHARHSPCSQGSPSRVPTGVGPAFCGEPPMPSSRRLPGERSRRSRAAQAGELAGEADPEFLAAVNQGRRIDIWDAVAIALGEKEPPAIRGVPVVRREPEEEPEAARHFRTHRSDDGVRLS